MSAFSLDRAGTKGIDPDLPWAEFAREHAGDGVDRGLRARVNRTVRRCEATGNGANVDDAASLSEVVHSGLRHKEEAQHVDIEVPVKCSSVMASIGQTRTRRSCLRGCQVGHSFGWLLGSHGPREMRACNGIIWTLNPAFESSTPLQVIERGESDRLWRMICEPRMGNSGD